MRMRASIRDHERRRRGGLFRGCAPHDVLLRRIRNRDRHWPVQARGVVNRDSPTSGAAARPACQGFYDPAVIAHMEFTTLPEGKTLPPIRMVRVRLQNG